MKFGLPFVLLLSLAVIVLAMTTVFADNNTPTSNGTTTQTTASSATMGPGKRVQLIYSKQKPAPSAAEIEENEQRLEKAQPPAPLTPVVPNGPQSPMPRETVVPFAPPAASSRAPGDFTYFQYTDVTAAQGSTSLIGEPTAANNGNAVFYTGNWYAAISSDDGATFNYVNPYTAFPGSYGGFCCDQLTLYDPVNDVFLWVLQYSTDGSNNNEIRIAEATGKANLEAGNWCYYDFTPQMMGAANGTNFDQPKIQRTGAFAYMEATQYGATGGSVVWRMPLASLAACSGFSFNYYFPGLFSPGFTQGATDTMYFAAHVSTSSLRVFTWPDSTTTVTTNDVTHTSYPQNYPYSCPRSGGSPTSDWCQRRSFGGGWAHSDRVHYGWVSKGVIGFFWDASQGAGGFGTFNYPYVHVVRLDQTTKALLNEPILFSGTNAWTWGSMGVNERGDLAGTVFWGGGSYYANCATLIWDDITPSPPAPWEVYTATSSDMDPSDTLWGDYSMTYPETDVAGPGYQWQGTCYALQSNTSTIHPYYLRFGRQRDAEIPLTNHISFDNAVTGATSQAEWKWHCIDVPPGQNKLEVDLYNLSADADLYVRYDAKSNFSSYDCRPFSGGTAPETCTFDFPAAGRWWIGVNNFATGTINFTVRATSCVFCDEFNDGVLDPNWIYTKPGWSEDGTYLIGNGTTFTLARPAFAGCTNCGVETTVATAGGIGNKVWIYGWWLDAKNQVQVLMKQETNKWLLKQKSNGVIVAKNKGTSTITPLTLYKVNVYYTGSTFDLYVNGTFLTSIPAASAPFGTVGFKVKNTTGFFDYILVD